jgi:hypothetical protein
VTLALSLIGVRGFANMNAPKTLDSGIPDFPICFYTGSLPQLSLWSTGPYYMTSTLPHRVFGDFNVMLIRSWDLRWVPVVDLSTILSTVAMNLPPVLLTVGVAPTYLSLIGNSRIAIFPCSKPLPSNSPISRCPISDAPLALTHRGQVRSM